MILPNGQEITTEEQQQNAAQDAMKAEAFKQGQEAQKKITTEKKEPTIESNNDAISKAKVGDTIRRKDGSLYTLTQGDINYAKQQVTPKEEVKEEPKEEVEEKKEEIVEDVSDDSPDETVEKVVDKILKPTREERRNERKASREEELEQKVFQDSEEAKRKREEWEKRTGEIVRPQIGRMKDALARGEITKSQYNHFVFDRVMTAAGKALGTFITRDPQWLFYKDQWQQRNDNLLNEIQRLDRAKTTATETDEERKGAQARDEEKVFTGEEAFAHNDQTRYNLQNEAAKGAETIESINANIQQLYERKQVLQEEYNAIARGDKDIEYLANSLDKIKSSLSGVYQTTNYKGRNVNENASQTDSSTTNKGVNASVGADVKVAKVNVDGHLDNTKGSTSTSGSNVLDASNWSTTYDGLVLDAQKGIAANWQANSKQFQALQEKLLQTISAEIRDIDVQLKYYTSERQKITNEKPVENVEDSTTVNTQAATDVANTIGK